MNNPVFLAVLTIILWSFGSYLSRLISMKSQFILLSLSYVFTFATHLLYSIYEHKGAFLRKLKAVRMKDLLFGPFGYFIYSVGLMQSYREFNSASETTILNYTWPVFTVIFTESLFRGTAKRTRGFRIVETLGVILGFLSVVILATKGNPTSFEAANLRGIGWGLLSGISYGLFSSYSSTVPRDSQGAFLLSSISVSLVLMSSLSVPEMHLVATFTLEDLLIVAALGCLLNGIGYVTWTAANRLARERGMNISSIASLMFVLPLLSLIVIATLLKETQLFQFYFIASLVLVVSSAVLCQKAQEIAKFLPLS